MHVVARISILTIFAVLLVVSFLPIVRVNAVVVTLQPSEADTRISETFPTLNFGPSSEMPAMVTQVSGTDYIERSLVRFDLSSIPAGSTIYSATLTLFCKSVMPGAGAYDYTVYRATFDWDEGTVTWNSVSGGSWSTANSATITGIYLNQFSSWTVTGIVIDWITNAVANQGFIIVIQATSGSCGGTFSTNEYGTGSAEWAPELQVDYGPPARPVINSEWTNNPPSIDGQMSTGEWTNLQLHLVPDDYPIDAYVYVLNDASNLYFLVDAVDDETDSPSDECLLAFNFGAEMDGVEVIGAGGTISSNGYLAAIGFGASPNYATEHKIYEFSIPFSYIGKRPGDSIDFSSPLQAKFPGIFASMPYDAGTGYDNIWPAGMGTEHVGDVNYWGLLNSKQQSRAADPYRYVGGELVTANKLAVLSPYLALIGVVAVAAVLVRRRKI